MIERNFNLHLTAGHSTALVINVNQFDQGEKWIFTLYNENGTQYIPSTGAIVGIKSDGLGIINSGSVVDGKVVIMETEQMTAAVGKAVFELMIDSQTHGTANFIVLVEPKPGNNADLSESDLSLLQEAIDATSPLPTGGTVGQVLTKTASGSTWSDAGTPTQEQVADAVSDWADEHITVTTGVVIDTSLAVAGAAADSKTVGDELSDLKSAIQSGGSFNAEVKAALDAFTASVLQLAEKVAYIDANGQDYYDDIDDAADALHSAMYPPVNLSSISAVYTQSGTVYDTDSLDSLKTDIVVTAYYSDGTSSVVTNYVLSGTLDEATSTITVSYGGKTASISVAVTITHVEWDYTEGNNGKITGHIMNHGSVTFEDDGVLLASGNTTAWYDVAQILVNVPSGVSLSDKILTCELSYKDCVIPNSGGGLAFFTGSPDYLPRLARLATKTFVRVKTGSSALTDISAQWGTWNYTSGQIKIVFNPSTHTFTLFNNGTQVYTTSEADITVSEYDHDYNAGTIAEVQRGNSSGEYKIKITHVNYSWEDIS